MSSIHIKWLIFSCDLVRLLLPVDFLSMYVCIYLIKFRVQENLYNIMNRDTIGNYSKGTQIKW